MQMSLTSNSPSGSADADDTSADAGAMAAPGIRERRASAAMAARDVFLHPVIATVITLGLIALVTWWISWLRYISGGTHPYLILYLIPVAVGAAFLGVRGGVAATAIILVLARIFLLNDHKAPMPALFSIPEGTEPLDFMTVAMGTLSIAAVAGRLRSTLVELRRSNERMELANVSLAAANLQLIESEQLRRDFNRDVLLAVTAGKLQLVERSELPGPHLSERTPLGVHRLEDPLDATKFRQALQGLVFGSFMDVERTADLLTSATEAATNAIKHGRGGEATIWIAEDSVYVLVVDNGTGIAPTHLARATLEKGYSTRISLGMGFHMILESCDSLSLSTGEGGTALLIRVSNCPRGSDADQVLAKYLKL